jgi:alpha/beta superfamily hydrolase
MIDDYLTYSRGRGFSSADVTVEVHVWHGAKDPLVPVEPALQLAVALRRCPAFVDPDEGDHFFWRRLEEILAMLLGCTGVAWPPVFGRRQLELTPTRSR